jgi:hypothetical protein
MSYCDTCKVLLPPDLTQCPYCYSKELLPDPPDPSQGDWVSLPNIPGIVEAQEIGPHFDDESIQYYIDQSGTGTHIEVGTEKYDRAKEIQEEVLSS